MNRGPSNFSIKIFKTCAWAVSLYHLTFGLIGTFAPSKIVIQISSTVFGMVLDYNQQVIAFARFLGPFFTLLGLIAALIAVYPNKYHDLIWLIVLIKKL